jgi:hypothetical protein
MSRSERERIDCLPSKSRFLKKTYQRSKGLPLSNKLHHEYCNRLSQNVQNNTSAIFDELMQYDGQHRLTEHKHGLTRERESFGQWGGRLGRQRRSRAGALRTLSQRADRRKSLKSRRQMTNAVSSRSRRQLLTRRSLAIPRFSKAPRIEPSSKITRTSLARSFS